MRITIDLPDDIHEKVAVDALKRPRNSKEAVIADILRAHYGGGTRDELIQRALGWRIDRQTGRTVHMRDLLMASVADAARVRLLTADTDFQPLVDLGLDIRIVTVESTLPPVDETGASPAREPSS